MRLYKRILHLSNSYYNAGPVSYTHLAGAVKETIELLHKLYQIRTCNRNLPRDIGLDRPCLNYHIHQCQAPCQGYVSKEEYRESVNQVVSFLDVYKRQAYGWSVPSGGIMGRYSYLG